MKRRQFTPQHKSKVVELVRTSAKSVGKISRELDLTETAVRAWLKQTDVGVGKGPKSADDATT